MSETIDKEEREKMFDAFEEYTGITLESCKTEEERDWWLERYGYWLAAWRRGMESAKEKTPTIDN